MVMERVGGYLAYLELCENARAYDDVVITLEAEAEAEAIRKLEAQVHGG